MIYRRRTLVLICVLTVALGWMLTQAGARDDSDAAAVRAVLDRQVGDWNNHDLEAFLTGYDRSPKTVFLSGGDRMDGWDAMRDRYRKRYLGEGKEMGRLVFSGVEVETFSPSSAFARGRWQLTLSDGSRPGGLFTLIVRKTADGWKIVHDHTSAAATPAPAEKKPQ
jgi:beta-aspartyl-peptidase (threonine type)